MLEAEPGDFVTIARKAKGKDEWYVGGITDENTRTANVRFDYLPKGKTYIATIYADAKDASWNKNPQKYEVRKVLVTSKSVLKQQMAPGGCEREGGKQAGAEGTEEAVSGLASHRIKKAPCILHGAFFSQIELL